MSLHVLVNVSYVCRRKAYIYAEPFAYLFVLSNCQLAAHGRALLAWDNRVDTRLINRARLNGARATVHIAICLAWFPVWCPRQLVRRLREAERTFRIP
jgi:hypothetical protein